MAPHVLVVSRDPVLLQTRRLILGTFFEVHGAERVSEAEALLSTQAIDLVILCYTLSPAERRAVMELVAGRKWRPALLLVTRVGRVVEQPDPGMAIMTEAGPYYLLKKAAEILGMDINMKTHLVEA